MTEKIVVIGKPEISRDAQVIAIGLFGFGKGSVTFNDEHRLTERARSAFDELEQHGMVKRTDPMEMRRGAIGWHATQGMGLPVKDFPFPSEDENFVYYRGKENE